MKIPEYLKLPDELYARVIELMPDGKTRKCLECGTALTAENTAYWINEHICRSCVSTIGGVHVDDATAMLLARGYMLLIRYRATGRNRTRTTLWRMRIDVRSGHNEELLKLKSTFGGGIAAHAKSTWRWTTQSTKTIHELGRVVRQYVPQLGEAMIRYSLQQGYEARSAYAEALAATIGTSVKFSQYVRFGPAEPD